MAFDAVIKGLEYTGRAIQVADAIIEIKENVEDPKLSVVQKTGQIAFNSIFIATEIGAGGIALLGDKTSHAHFHWTVAAGTADIARNVHRLCWKGELNHGDYLDLLGVLALRVSQITNSALVLNRPLFGFDPKALQGIENIAAAAATLIQGRHSISSGCMNAWNAIQSVLQYLRGAGISSETEIAVSVNEQFVPALAMDPIFSRRIRGITQANSIDEFIMIPEIFRHDPVLKQCRCSLSLQPIRFPVSIQDFDGEVIAHYEKSTILGYLTVGLEHRPNGWPENIPLCRESLKECPVQQERINRHLENLLLQFKSLELDDLSTQTFAQLADAIGISNAAISGKQLGLAIQRSFDPEQKKKIGALSVLEARHAFVPNSPEQEVWTIKLQTRSYTQKVDLSVRNPESFLRAILGSSRPSDKAALDEFINTPVQLKILIARDLRYHSITIE